MANDTAPKTRRPKARHRDVVIGGIKENVLMFEKVTDTDTGIVIASRIEELADELRRSLNGKELDEQAIG